MLKQKDQNCLEKENGKPEIMYLREINKQYSKLQLGENLEHPREIKRQSLQKGKAENPEHIREINKQSNPK